MRNIQKSEKGAVTLYLLIIFIAIFFFNAVLIDYSRIMAANKELQNGMHASTRSTLASYDKKLKNSYGLYAIEDANKIDEKMYKMLSRNLTSPIEEDFFRFTNISLDEEDIKTEIVATLASHDWFEYQIKEEMKYKGPIEFALALKEMANFSKANKEAEKYQKKAKEYDKGAKKREDKLNEIKDIEKKIISEMNQDEPDEGKISKYKNEFKDLLNEAENIQKELTKIEDEIKEIEKILNNSDNNEDTINLDLDEIYDMDYYSEMHDEFNNMESDLDSYEEYVDDREQKREKYQEQIKNAKKKALEEVKKEIKSNGDAEIYGGTDEDYIKDLEKNISDKESAGKKLEELYKSYYDGQDEDSSENKTSPAEFLQSITTATVDNICINEYALMYFNNKVKKVAENKEHEFSEAEVEFIIYGKFHPDANYALACVEIYGIRFLIRSIEAIKMFKASSPAAVAAAILTYATSMAAYDLERLKSGKLVELSRYMRKVELSYEHYIRLFLIHPNKKQKLSRMQALISLDKDIHLAEKPVHIVSTAGPAINLLFIPAVIKSLNIGGGMGGRLDGEGRYKLHQSATMYY